jgi:hypothetical protein
LNSQASQRKKKKRSRAYFKVGTANSQNLSTQPKTRKN